MIAVSSSRSASYMLCWGEREFFIDNLLVRVHFIIVMIRWTGLAPPQPFEFLFPGRRADLEKAHRLCVSLNSRLESHEEDLECWTWFAGLLLYYSQASS